MYVVTLQDGPLSPEEVGGKAASLTYLIHHQVAVPPGFVVTTHAHQAYWQDGGASGPMPDDLAEEVRQALSAFAPTTRFAVRSSATFEDLASASFAGQYDTVLDVGAEEVMPAIFRCWASAANHHAHSYAAQHGLSLEQSSMGVIVQALVPAETAGVSFSLHPVTGADEVVINAAYGLGESVVSGMVTPDTFIVDKATSRIESLLGDKEAMLRPRPEGGTEEVETSEELRTRFCLSDRDVIRVHQLTLALERLAGYPVDVEWAIADDSLYCLQMRPIALKGVMHA